MNEMQRISVEHAIKELRKQAEPVGPLHSFWDTIFELEAMLQSSEQSLHNELEEWRQAQLVLPDESDAEHALRCAFQAQRFLKKYHRSIQQQMPKAVDMMVAERFASEYWELHADGTVFKVRCALSETPEWVTKAAAAMGITP